MNTHLSVVIPEYKGATMIHELVRRIVTSVSTITEDYEIILVNDASPDDTWCEIEKVCAKDKRVKGLNLSRNFGQHYAITAGLAYAKGDWVVVMDCDLQDRPEDIPALYAKAQEGFDMVRTRRVVKKVGWWKRTSSILYHAALDWLSGYKTDPTIGNFGIYKQNVIEEYNRIPQKARAFGTILSVLGFKIAYLDVEQDVRGEGKSSYTMAKLFEVAFTVIIARTNKPLRFAVKLGFSMSILSLLIAIYNIVAKLVGIIQVSGYTTTVFSIWFVGGMILFVLGIMGLYIGRIFDQVKGQPLFVVRETINIKK